MDDEDKWFERFLDEHWMVDERRVASKLGKAMDGVRLFFLQFLLPC